MSSETEIEYLLDDLCVELGFCLSPVMKARLVKFPPKTPEKFANAVVCADGLNPATIEQELYSDILLKVEKTFMKNETISN
jgi:hypothetical protein